MEEKKHLFVVGPRPIVWSYFLRECSDTNLQISNLSLENLNDSKTLAAITTHSSSFHPTACMRLFYCYANKISARIKKLLVMATIYHSSKMVSTKQLDY